MVSSRALAHPVTGQEFASPVLPGAGWPGDPARPDTEPARTPEEAWRQALAAEDPHALNAAVSVCRACPRLVEWREQVAVEKRRAFADQPYWGRPVPSLGDPQARLVVVGLAPAAHGGNRTGRMFTGDRSGDWIQAALHRAGYANQPTSVHAGDGFGLDGARIVAPVHCAPPQNKPTAEERATCAAWFDRELDLLTRARGIMALGGIAWQSVLAAASRLGWQVPRPRPKFSHGATAILRRTIEGRERAVHLIGCYHVSQQNTFTGRLTQPMLDDILHRFTTAGAWGGEDEEDHHD